MYVASLPISGFTVSQSLTTDIYGLNEVETGSLYYGSHLRLATLRLMGYPVKRMVGYMLNIQLHGEHLPVH